MLILSSVLSRIYRTSIHAIPSKQKPPSCTPSPVCNLINIVNWRQWWPYHLIVFIQTWSYNCIWTYMYNILNLLYIIFTCICMHMYTKYIYLCASNMWTCTNKLNKLDVQCLIFFDLFRINWSSSDQPVFRWCDCECVVLICCKWVFICYVWGAVCVAYGMSVMHVGHMYVLWWIVAQKSATSFEWGFSQRTQKVLQQ